MTTINAEHLLDPEVHQTRPSVAIHAPRPSTVRLATPSNKGAQLYFGRDAVLHSGAAPEAPLGVKLRHLREVLQAGIDQVDAALANLAIDSAAPASDLAEVAAALDGTGDPDVDECPPVDQLVGTPEDERVETEAAA